MPASAPASKTDEMAAEIAASLAGTSAPADSPPAQGEALVRQHERWLRGVIYAVLGRLDLVDDVMQDVWIRACQQADRIRDPQRVRSWLYRVARNAAIDARRRLRRRDALPLERVKPPATPVQTTPAEHAMRTELHHRLLRAVEALPAHYREPFVLRHLEGWSYAQIGELLGLGPETVETRLVRARRLLREMLDEQVRP